MSLNSKLNKTLYDSLEDCKPGCLINKFVSIDNNILNVNNVKYDLTNKKVYIIGFGKASAGMAYALENIIGISRIASGIIVTTPTKVKTTKITLIESSHPKLTEKSFNAGKQILNYVKQIPKESLVICLNSGGGSALVASPNHNLSIDEKMDFFEFLLMQGINEIDQNIVRKSISSIKGGKLGELINNNRSMLINLVIMDNPYDYKALSSGPTFSPDYNKTAKSILENENIFSNINKKIRDIIELDLNRSYDFDETLIQDVIIGGPMTVKNNFIKHASLNFDHVWSIESVYYNMNINNVLDDFILFCNKKMKSTTQPGNYAIIANGEVPIKVPSSHGKGGRNQHFAALVLQKASEYKWTNFAFASFATDGQDFIKNIHGAMISDDNLKYIDDHNIDVTEYIYNYDSFNLHTQLGTLLKGDLSGTNCSDLYTLGFMK